MLFYSGLNAELWMRTVTLIQVDVQHAGICYVHLALPECERLRLHPHLFEEVQLPLRKKEAEVVLVELCLCSILIHDYNGASFHGIYLNGWIFLSYQTREFAGEPLLFIFLHDSIGYLMIGASR